MSSNKKNKCVCEKCGAKFKSKIKNKAHCKQCAKGQNNGRRNQASDSDYGEV